jgi:hypothetical protein
MTSDENRRILQKAGGQYILGEKLRGNHMSEMALRQPVSTGMQKCTRNGNEKCTTLPGMTW